MLYSDCYEDAIRIRRDLHQIPETGFKEVKTQQYIMNFLNDLGLNYETMAETGVVCFLDMNREDTVALRSDMDGLPIEEKNNVDYKSIHPGKMHACGHDGHITMLLLFAKHIVTEKIRLPKNIILLFQPAEEGPGGARKVIEEGILNEVRYQKHIRVSFISRIPLRGICRCGRRVFRHRVSNSSSISIGQGSHGAEPHKGTDALMVGTKLISDLRMIVPCDVDPLQDCIFHVGTFHSGKQLNILAATASITGIVRTFNIQNKRSDPFEDENNL